MTRKIKLKLVGLDGNAFSLLGVFQDAARSQGWTRSEIQTVLDKAMNGDYRHLIATLADHCVCGGMTDACDYEE